MVAQAVEHVLVLFGGRRVEVEQPGHPRIGHELLSGSQNRFIQTGATIALRHHERYDGTGYPRGLAGMSIPLAAEMAGIVDSYCAMTRERVYRGAVSSQRAMETLNQLRDTQFRETLVDQFLQCIGLYPIGTLVELNSGEVGVVIQQNQVRRLQPRVLVLLAPDKSIERFPRTLDLLMQPEFGDGEPYRNVQARAPHAYGIDPNDFYLA